jgi:hypothetical protein
MRVRYFRAILGALALTFAGCGDGGDSQGGSGGTSGSGCSGSLSGAVDGAMTSCIAAVNYYPDGGQLVEDRKNSLFTLVASTGLPSGVQGVGLNFELNGAPATGSFDIASSVPGGAHLGYVHAGAAIYDEIKSATLVLSGLTSLGEQDLDGKRNEVFLADGTLALTVADSTGATVTVDAAF